MVKKKQTTETQSERFIAAARKAGCSEDEAVFDENLKRIVKGKPKNASDKDMRRGTK